MKRLYIIGGMDSLGVPYTKDNVNFSNHLTFTKLFLNKLGYLTYSIDMYSMARYNTPAILDNYIKTNITYSEIKENQKEGIFLCRMQGIFQYIKLSKRTGNKYESSDEDSKIRLTETIRDNDCIFIYSNCINDFFEKLNITLDKLITKRGIKETLAKFKELAPVVSLDIMNNIELLKSVNPNIEIYILGLYIPSRVNFIRDLLTASIIEVNSMLESICNKYDNVHFVDNMNIEKKNIDRVDFHFNLSGQELVGSNIIACLKNKSKILARK